MCDEHDPEPEDELDDESQADLGSDNEQPGLLMCMYCMADNDEVKLRAVQHNQCWKCGKIINEFVRFPNGAAPANCQFGTHSPFARWNKIGLAILLLSLIGIIWYIVLLYQSPQR
ncbi:MAG: hypothetical protein ACYC1M_07990 [Armatimonadota bacterium]